MATLRDKQGKGTPRAFKKPSDWLTVSWTCKVNAICPFLRIDFSSFSSSWFDWVTWIWKGGRVRSSATRERD